MAGELPLFETEPPHLEQALTFWNLHPVLEVMAVRFGRGGIPANTEAPAPVSRAVRIHDVIIADRIGTPSTN